MKLRAFVFLLGMTFALSGYAQYFRYIEPSSSYTPVAPTLPPPPVFKIQSTYKSKGKENKKKKKYFKYIPTPKMQIGENPLNYNTGKTYYKTKTTSKRTYSCARCRGTGYYYWPGVPRFNDSQHYINCRNCGVSFETSDSHMCECRKCGGTGYIVVDLYNK